MGKEEAGQLFFRGCLLNRGVNKGDPAFLISLNLSPLEKGLWQENLGSQPFHVFQTEESHRVAACGQE